MKEYKAYLIDLDGTMYKGNQVIEEAPRFIRWLKSKETPYLFLTNNSSMTPLQVARKLNKMGIECSESEIFTSSMAVAKFISTSNHGRKVYAIGEEGLFSALNEQRCVLEDENPDYVVVGIDRNFTYEKMAKASLAIQKGARFLSTNSDRAIPTEQGLVPGNGALTAAISVASDQIPTFIGKPETLFVELALQRLNLSADEVLLVGDNLHTDIAAGVNANVDTLLVFTGITRPDNLYQQGIQPTYKVDHLLEWMD